MILSLLITSSVPPRSKKTARVGKVWVETSALEERDGRGRQEAEQEQGEDDGRDDDVEPVPLGGEEEHRNGNPGNGGRYQEDHP